MLSWRSIRPRGPWVLLKVAPRPTATPSGSIVFPDFLTTYEKGMTGTGKVLAKGPGVDKVLGGDYVQIGTNVLFRDFVKDVTTRYFERHEDGSLVGLFKADDLIGVVEA